jgi:predicted nucleic acid-binding protein
MTTVDLVIDTSVLVAELLRERGRLRLEHPALTLSIPEHGWSEIRYELPKRVAALTQRASLTTEESRWLVARCLDSVAANVSIVPEVAYMPLVDEARWRVERDPGDWPIVALALATRAAIWTEDRDFLGCGVATWTTSTLSRLLVELEQGDEHGTG